MQPAQLFIAADGPRTDREGEKEKCEEVRKWVLSQIDWECELKTLFRNENVGCGKAVSESISWFFENVEQGIILEDDVLPDKTFFLFSEQMLNFYKDDRRVMQISGNNFIAESFSNNKSYFFSKYVHIWGWATWKRAWNYYDFELKNLDMITFRKITNNVGLGKIEKKYWNNIYEFLNQERQTIWDYQWLFSIWKNKGVSIIPNCNLVSNIGFGVNATHTFDTESKLAKFPVSSMIFPLVHENRIRYNKKADKLISKEGYNIKIEAGEILIVRLCKRLMDKFKM